jgi:hypothetical protein
MSRNSTEGFIQSEGLKARAEEVGVEFLCPACEGKGGEDEVVVADCIDYFVWKKCILCDGEGKITLRKLVK